jgi:peptide/nickel transport system permease protein
MSAVPAPGLPARLDYPPTSTPLRSESYWVQVARDTLRRRTAVAGLLWILVLVFCAIFAPVLANTCPILLKVNAQWSSPMIHFLAPADVSLFVLVFCFLGILIFRKFPLRNRVIWALCIFAGLTGLAFKFVHPPETADWTKWRQLDRDGAIQFKLMAPIPYSPLDYQRDNPDAAFQPPDSHHLFGTETNGGDVLSGMLHATRVALLIGLISTGIAVVIGVFIGGLMGYFVGTVDILGMRLIEIFEAIPTLFLLVMCVATLPPQYGRNIYGMMVIIGATTWTSEARYIRAEFLRLRQQDFVQAAIAAGLPLRSIIFRHLLPNGISPILVTSSFGVASAILFESTLSFLGLGPVDAASWGKLLNQAMSEMGLFVWWIAVFPGLAIFLTVFSYNLIGEALRDALDPKLLQ